MALHLTAREDPFMAPENLNKDVIKVGLPAPYDPP
jgi:hypothetical protein